MSDDWDEYTGPSKECIEFGKWLKKYTYNPDTTPISTLAVTCGYLGWNEKQFQDYCKKRKKRKLAIDG